MERDHKGLFTVINSERSGERDRIITILSPSEGLLKARIYGAQKSAKSVKAPLFSDAVFSLYGQPGHLSVKDIDVINLRSGILDDIDRTTAAVLFSELAMASKIYDRPLYDLVAKALDALSIGLDYKRVCIMFIIKYLSMLGTFGDYEHCPVCQKVYSEDEILGYNSLVGASCCQNCSTGEENLLLPPNARAFIRESIKAEDDRILLFGLSDNQEERIFRFLLRLLKASFPSELKTLSSGMWPLL